MHHALSNSSRRLLGNSSTRSNSTDTREHVSLYPHRQRVYFTTQQWRQSPTRNLSASDLALIGRVTRVAAASTGVSTSPQNHSGTILPLTSVYGGSDIAYRLGLPAGPYSVDYRL